MSELGSKVLTGCLTVYMLMLTTSVVQLGSSQDPQSSPSPSSPPLPSTPAPTILPRPSQSSPPSTPDLIGTDGVVPGNLALLPVASESGPNGSAISPLDAATWRRKLEDEEIQRYLTDFGKVCSYRLCRRTRLTSEQHVRHLRVPIPAKAPPIMQRPQMADYTLSPMLQRRIRDRAVEAGSIQETAAVETSEKTESDVASGSASVGDVDWMAYVAAVR